MTFPEVPLDAQLELFIGNDEWLDIYARVRGDGGITLTPGQNDQQSEPTFTKLTATVNVHDDYFIDPNNPRSEYHGRITQNTPVILSTASDDDSVLYLPQGLAHSYDNAAPGVTTPDNAALDITGDIDIRVELTLEEWEWYTESATTIQRVIVAKWPSWIVLIEANSTVTLICTTNGSTQISFNSGTRLSSIVDPGDRIAIRVTLDVDDDGDTTAAFSYALDGINGSYSGLGGGSNPGTSSIFSSSARLEIATNRHFSNVRTVWGNIHKLQIRNGINGTVVANPDFTDKNPGITVFTDSAGREWTVNGRAYITRPNALFWGELSSFHVDADNTNTDVTVSIVAYGILRRLNQSGRTQSPLYSELTSADVASELTGYWPCEEGTRSRVLLSPYTNVSALTIVGSPLFAESDICAGSLPVLQMSDDSALVCPLLPQTPPLLNSYFQRWITYIPDTLADETALLTIRTNGSAAIWRLRYHTGGALSLTAYNNLNVELAGTGPIAFDMDNTNALIMVSLVQDGSNVDTGIYVLKVSDDISFGAGQVTPTFTSMTMGQPTSFTYAQGRDCEGMGIGHIVVANTELEWFSGSLPRALVAYRSETVGMRLARLNQNGQVPLAFTNESETEYGSTPTVRLGAQSNKDDIDVVFDSFYADGGMLFQLPNAPALYYKSRHELAQQTVFLELDYSDTLFSKLAIKTDDFTTDNRVTSTRENGPSVTVALEADDSIRSIEAPPYGIYPYDTPLSGVPVFGEGESAELAAFVTSLGANESESRFSEITVNLARQPFIDNPALAARIQHIWPGTRIRITNLPDWLWPPTADLLILDRKISITNSDSSRAFVFTFICVAYASYDIKEVTTSSYPQNNDTTDAADDRIDVSRVAGGIDIVLNTDIDTTETELEITSRTGISRLGHAGDDSDGGADFPLPVTLGGEELLILTVGQPLGTYQSRFDGSISGWEMVGNSSLSYQSAGSTGTSGDTALYRWESVTGCLRIDADGSLSFGGATTTAATSGNVSVGAEYIVHAHVLREIFSTGSVAVGIDWYDGSAMYLSTSIVTNLLDESDMTVWAWYGFSGVATAPASAVTGRPLIRLTDTPDGTWFVDDVYLIPKTTAEGDPQYAQVLRSRNGLAKSHNAYPANNTPSSVIEVKYPAKVGW